MDLKLGNEKLLKRLSKNNVKNLGMYAVTPDTPKIRKITFKMKPAGSDLKLEFLNFFDFSDSAGFVCELE